MGRCEVPGFIQGWGTKGMGLFLILIKGTKGRSNVNQVNKGDGLKIFLCACRGGKTRLRSSASC